MKRLLAVLILLILVIPKHSHAVRDKIRFIPGGDVVSASELVLREGSEFDVTGTTTISSIAHKELGAIVALQFDGILQLTHSADLFMPTAANVTTAAGDIALFYEYATGDWRCMTYMRADGTILSDRRKRYYPATLSDTTTPHDLTAIECSGTLITTQGWNGTDDIAFNLPDISAYDGTEGVLKVKFLDSKGMQDADTDMYVDPDASTQVVLDGTITGTDGDRVWWDDVAIYSGMVCHSDYDATLGGYWVCDSLNGLAADKGS